MVAVQTLPDSQQSISDTCVVSKTNESAGLVNADSLELLTAYFGSKTDEVPLGDGEVLSELFLNEKERLFRFARLKGFSAADAEAIVSDCFYNLMSRKSNFDPEKGNLSYFYKLLDNTCLDYYRRECGSKTRKGFIRFSDISSNEDYTKGHSFEAVAEGSTPTPPEIISREETREEVRSAIEALENSSDRALLTLRYYDGLKYREAAKALKINIGTFKSRFHSVKQRLAGLLDHLK